MTAMTDWLDRILPALVGELADASLPMPGLTAIAQLLRCDQQSVGGSMLRLESAGVLTMRRSGKGASFRIAVTLADGRCTMPGQALRRPDPLLVIRAARRAGVPPVNPAPVVRRYGQAAVAEAHHSAPAAPNRTRCPSCNLPPHHAECRHGWDGETTRAMRVRSGLVAAAARRGFTNARGVRA